MKARGLRAVDNTPEEIREIVREMLDRLDGQARYSEEDELRQASFRALADRHGLVGFPDIGRDFLRRHAELLPASTSRRAG
jgi:hypothetical protein